MIIFESLFGLIHTRHFRTQYFDKKIFFLNNIVHNDISKYLELSPKKYFQYTQERILDENGLFYI